MKESSFWHSIKTGLEKASDGKIFLQRIEDKFARGVPDVHYCYEGHSGWIELKYLPKRPKKIIIKHFTASQKLWLYNYYKKGGSSWLLLRIEKEVYLIPGYAVQSLQLNDTADLYDLADLVFKKEIDYHSLLTAFKRRVWINS